MAPILSLLISSGSKKKEPRYVCLSEAKVSLRLKILNDLWVQERDPDILLITPKSPGKWTPSSFPNKILVEAHIMYKSIICLKVSHLPGTNGWCWSSCRGMWAPQTCCLHIYSVWEVHIKWEWGQMSQCAVWINFVCEVCHTDSVWRMLMSWE